MSFRNCLASFLCVLVLFFSTSMRAQDKQLSDATTFVDVAAFASQEMGKIAKDTDRASILFSAADKLLVIAQNDMEKRTAYSWKLTAFQFQIRGGMEGAEQKMETFLEEIASHEDANIRGVADNYRFSQFRQRATMPASSPEELDKTKAEFKTWVNRGSQHAYSLVSLGLQIAERNEVPAEQFIKDLTAFIQSPECTLPEAKKQGLTMAVDGLFRLAAGSDPKLYGKTLDDKNFEWEKLRGKYVLIKFTATWCGPCAAEIPSMKEAYEKYHAKGFEIVSVYVGETAADPVVAVKQSVEEKQIPWIIISEELSKKAGHPEYGTFYNVFSVPTMILVNREGKIIKTGAVLHGKGLQTTLTEIFR